MGKTINGEEEIAAEEMTLPDAPPEHLSVRREIVGINPVTTITWRKFDATVVCAIPMLFGILCIFFGLPGGPVLEKGFSFKAFAANIPFLLFIPAFAWPSTIHWLRHPVRTNGFGVDSMVPGRKGSMT